MSLGLRHGLEILLFPVALAITLLRLLWLASMMLICLIVQAVNWTLFPHQ